MAGDLCFLLAATPLAAIVDPRLLGSLLALGGLVVALLARRRAGGTRWTLTLCLTAAALTLLLDVNAFLGHREIGARFRDGDIELAGTLYEPRGGGPFPAVILMHGSSPGTRGIFRPFANRFVSRGVATLIYDKRGFGASGGELPYTYDELARDALAGLRYLQGRSEIEPTEIGLMGFSEGGWTAPLAASRSADIAFLAVVSGGALTPAQQELWEMRTRLEGAGFGPEEIARALDLQRRLNDFYRSSEGGDEVLAAVRRVQEREWFQVAFELSPDEIPDSLDQVRYTHDPTELDFDALPLLPRVRCPMLFLFGAQDRLVPPFRSAERIRHALSGRKGPDFRVEVLPGADHLLLVWPLGRQVPIPRFAPGYLRTLTRWILEHTG